MEATKEQIQAWVRVCAKCKQQKPHNEFYPSKTHKDGLLPHCKDCNREYRRLRYEKNPQARIESTNKNRNKLRDQVFEAYGSKCTCCQESHRAFLCIDHIDEDGAEHRRQLGKKAKGMGFYEWLRRNDFPEGFQILCWNCNSAKSLRGGCPHKMTGYIADLPEEKIRRLISEEVQKTERLKQDACDHIVSGTLNEDKSVTCSDCKKVLIFDPNESSSSIEMPNNGTAFFKGGGK